MFGELSVKKYFILFLLLVGIFSRVIPHLPNATAIGFVSLMLGALLPIRTAFISVLIMLFISDALVALINPYPLFGYWSLFTYSGFLLVTFLGSFNSQTFNSQTLHAKIINNRLIFAFLGSSLFFWLWTNFGVWLCSDLYTKTMNGLMMCYLMAIPFLRNQLINDLAWILLWYAASIVISAIVKRGLGDRVEC